MTTVWFFAAAARASLARASDKREGKKGMATTVASARNIKRQLEN
jgi:hypothetical protein